MSPEKIARNWMQEVAVTAAAGDLEAHMDLVSKRVQVVGEPGFDGIDYADWVRQCSHEFENRLLKGVDYRGSNCWPTRMHGSCSRPMRRSRAPTAPSMRRA
jgi:hypothetical protein